MQTHRLNPKRREKVPTKFLIGPGGYPAEESYAQAMTKAHVTRIPTSHLVGNRKKIFVNTSQPIERYVTYRRNKCPLNFTRSFFAYTFFFFFYNNIRVLSRETHHR